MLRLVLLLLSLPLLAHGGEGIYYAARNRQPTTVNCAQFMQTPPQAQWLHVIGCDIDYMHPAFSGSGDRLREMFFAMRTRNEPPTAPVSLMIATRDPQALAVGQQAFGTGSNIDEESFTIAMLRIVDILRAAREVDGYARSGVIERFLIRRELTGFSAPLEADAIVLDLHARPSLLRPVIELAAALLLGAAALRRRRQPTAIDVSADRGAEPAATIAPVLEPRLPPVLLLNLEPTAPLSDIEYAPPLGSPEEVASQIAAVFGTLAPEGDGKYSVGGSDWRLEFDLGRDDPVWAVAVRVRGTDAALAALDRLTGETSWRVYVPRLGTFR